MTNIYTWLFGGRGKDAVTSPLPLLPEELQPFANAIGSTLMPVISACEADASAPLHIGSQLGGRPWWPKGKPFPKGTDGKPLYLLIQINFAQTPVLGAFPRSGLLQLFIGSNDHYGANFENLLKPTGFQCVFHEDLDQAMDEASAPVALERGCYSPLEEPMVAKPIGFVLEQMVVEVSDHRFERMLPAIAASEALTESYGEWTSEAIAVSAIRLGGYPTFTQQDPRAYAPNDTVGDMTLLTVDTTEGVMWGDSGVAQFFMHEADLKRRDFSRVAFNWDCC